MASKDFGILVGVSEVGVIFVKAGGVLNGTLKIIPDSKRSYCARIVAKALPDNFDTRTNERHGKAGIEDRTIGGRGFGRGYHRGKNRGGEVGGVAKAALARWEGAPGELR